MEKLKKQKWPVFHLISKHSLYIKFFSIFFNELLMSLRSTVELPFADTPAVNRTLLSMAPLWQCP